MAFFGPTKTVILGLLSLCVAGGLPGEMHVVARSSSLANGNIVERT